MRWPVPETTEPRLKPFVNRVATLPRIIEVLSYHGVVPISSVATEVGLKEQEVRDLLRRYYVSEDPRTRIGLPPPIAFLDDRGEEAEPAEATCVRLQGDYADEDLAFDYTPMAYIAKAYRIARDQSYLDPDNALLRSAVEKLRATLDPEMGTTAPTGEAALSPAEWYRAAVDHRRVRLLYARAWRPGTTERVIDPYRVVRTRRGWEVDAGPPDEDGRLRTFLLTGVVDAEVLDETFDPPADVVDLLVAQRRTTRVRFSVPEEKVWVVERQAERADRVDSDGQATIVDAELLEPVHDRIATILVISGADARVLEAPADESDAGREWARRLLEHHGL
jgi:proteasome accessory factor C